MTLRSYMRTAWAMLLVILGAAVLLLIMWAIPVSAIWDPKWALATWRQLTSSEADQLMGELGAQFWEKAMRHLLIHGNEPAVKEALRKANLFYDSRTDARFRADYVLLLLWDEPAIRFENLIHSTGPKYVKTNEERQRLLSFSLDSMLALVPLSDRIRDRNALPSQEPQGEGGGTTDVSLLTNEVTGAARSNDAETRLLAALAIGIAAYHEDQIAAEPNTVNVLTALLGDTNAQVRRTACVSARYFTPGPELTDLLRDKARADRVDGVRICALASLSRIVPASESAPLIKAALVDPEPSVRRYAAYTAAECMPFWQAALAVIPKAADRIASVRIAAFEALWIAMPVWVRLFCILVFYAMTVLVIEYLRVAALRPRNRKLSRRSVPLSPGARST